MNQKNLPTDVIRAACLMLLSDKRMTLLPDLYDLLGPHSTLELLELFGGFSIRFPSKSCIDDTLRKVAIWHLVRGDPSNGRVDFVAENYRMSRTKVLQIYNEVDSLVRKIDGNLQSLREGTPPSQLEASGDT